MADPIRNGKNQRLAAVKGKNTKPELMLRKALWARGLRYRLHVKDLPGRPDLVFPSARVAVFVDGDFWHGHDWENLRPKLKSEYWVKKIERNIERDEEQTAALRELGWRVIRLWEHEVKEDLATCASHVEQAIRDSSGPT